MPLVCTLWDVITLLGQQAMAVLVQALLQKAWQAVRTSVGPHMSVAGGYLERGFREVRRRTHGLTSNPTVGARPAADSAFRFSSCPAT